MTQVSGTITQKGVKGTLTQMGVKGVITFGGHVNTIDYDGNVYGTVQIGSLIWMTSNLKTTKYADGSAISNITNGTLWAADSTGAYCWYNNLIAYKTNWGAMYNWYAVNHTSGLAPTGWRIATDADWTTLTDYLGGLGVAGGILKIVSSAYWADPNTGAVNTWGFNKQGEGSRDEIVGDFGGTKSYGYAWTATAVNAATAYGRGFSYNNDDVVRNAYDKNVGFAVRCCKDV